MSCSIRAAAIAQKLGLILIGSGEDRIEQPADIDECKPGDVVWLRDSDPEKVALINYRKPSLVICDEKTALDLQVPCLIAPNPRLSFIRCLKLFFAAEELHTIHPTAVIHQGAVIGKHVSIGPYTRVDQSVCIGDDCVIGSGVSLEGEVLIGCRCHIKSNAVIGAPGFGFERDEEGQPIHFPHLGRVILEDDVWIGACSTIERATLNCTRLCKGVKVDDLVQIGHNTVIGENTLIMANSVLCGGVHVGSDCWIAPNSVIKQKVRIGTRVTVGLGAVVIRDVLDGQTVAGVPARPLSVKKESR